MSRPETALNAQFQRERWCGVSSTIGNDQWQALHLKNGLCLSVHMDLAGPVPDAGWYAALNNTSWKENWVRSCQGADLIKRIQAQALKCELSVVLEKISYLFCAWQLVFLNWDFWLIEKGTKGSICFKQSWWTVHKTASLCSDDILLWSVFFLCKTKATPWLPSRKDPHLNYVASDLSLWRQAFCSAFDFGHSEQTLLTVVGINDTFISCKGIHSVHCSLETWAHSVFMHRSGSAWIRAPSILTQFVQMQS